MDLNAAVIILAHPSVDGIKTGRGYSGSTHWNNAVRSRLYFTTGPQTKDEEAGPPSDPDTRLLESPSLIVPDGVNRSNCYGWMAASSSRSLEPAEMQKTISRRTNCSCISYPKQKRRE